MPPLTVEESQRRIDLLNLAVPFEIMRFKLTYIGPLRAAGNNSPRTKDKWQTSLLGRPCLRVRP